MKRSLVTPTDLKRMAAIRRKVAAALGILPLQVEVSLSANTDYKASVPPTAEVSYVKREQLEQIKPLSWEFSAKDGYLWLMLWF